MKFRYVTLLLFTLACTTKSTETADYTKTITDKNLTTFTLLPETQAMNLPFSDAAIIGDLVYTSGQIGNLPGSFDLVEGGVRAETRQALSNIANILEKSGSDIDHVIKCTVMLDDIADWPIVNEEYVKFFPNHKPARSAFATNGLALGAKLEIEAIATLK